MQVGFVPSSFELLDLRASALFLLREIMEDFLFCKNCEQELPVESFSKHEQCVSGYDTSRCKLCKKAIQKAKQEWAKKPIEAKILNRIKTRSTKKGIPFNLELEDIIIPEVCPVFKVPFIYGDHSWTYSVDRIKPELGYVKGNIVIISNKANMMKNTGTIEEVKMLYEWMITLENEISF